MMLSRLQSLPRTTLLTIGVHALFCSVALAQDPAVTPPPLTPDAPPAAEPAAPAAPEAVAPAPADETPAPAPAPAQLPAELTTEQDVAPPPPPDAAPTEEKPWYSDFTLGAFVDAYAAVRSDNNSRPPFHYVPYGGYYHEAYVQANGFALAFAGLDASYSGEKFGATISLRFGPGVNRFYAANMSDIGIQNLTQAFVTYKPIEKLTFDLGQFGTIYGAEVLESWKNINYSRGALYYAMQPFWHTGLRANFAATDSLSFNGLIVNGVNNAFENNKTPSLGLQALLTPNDTFSLAAGYLGALNPREGQNGVFQHFVDVVATVTSGGFKLIANFDINFYHLPGEEDGDKFWGISVAPSYAFNDFFGVGLRYEYLQDSGNLWGMTKTRVAVDPEDEDNGAEVASKATFQTITATLDIKPIPGSSALVLRPEFRYEIAGNYYFYNRDSTLTKNFWTVMLGAVVTSM